MQIVCWVLVESRRRLILFWREHHEHRPPFHVGRLLDIGHVLQFLGDFAQVFQRQFGIGDLTPSEANGNAHFHAVFQPPSGIAHFETLVMVTGFGAQADLFDLDFCLGFAGFAFLFFFVVKELTVVDDLDHRRIGIGGDLYQVVSSVIGAAKSRFDRDDPNILTVLVNQANGFAVDSFINAIFLFTADLLILLTFAVRDR